MFNFKFRPPQKFAIGLFLFLLGSFFFTRAQLRGDIDEYILMTVALTEHQSPDIHLDDIRIAQKLMPDNAASLQLIADGISSGKKIPKPGFYRAHNNAVFAIHFFSYSALATMPFFMFQKIGINPFDCFLWVNLSFVFVLGICLFQFFGEIRKASFALLLFFLSGGINYLCWSGPEMMSATALCAAMLLYSMRRYLLACVLIALASTQNPPIVFALLFVPLLHLGVNYQSDVGLFSNVKRQCSLRVMFALAFGSLGIIATMAFNWWAFGVPNIIVKVATNSDLASVERLSSYFFDLNQGMITGVLGTWIGVFALMFFGEFSKLSKFRMVCLFLIASLFSMALCLPALTTGNWNSGAIGMMRYAFWGSMPFMFLFFFLMREQLKSLNWVMTVVVVVQFLAVAHAFSYNEVQFSPFAKFVMRYVPNLYNPEPEIFTERSLHLDGAELNPNRYVIFDGGAGVTKVLFHARNPEIERELCGNGQSLGVTNRIVNVGNEWRYLNGNRECSDTKIITYQSFLDTGIIVFEQGWSGVEHGGGAWNGRWSDGEVSSLKIPNHQSGRIRGIKFVGYYFGKNKRTRIKINGRDYGWIDIASIPIMLVDVSDLDLKIQFQHEYPHDRLIAPEFPDGRRLSLFLQSVVVY